MTETAARRGAMLDTLRIRAPCSAAAARPRSGPAELRRSSAGAPPELRPADTGGAVPTPAPASRWFQVPLSRRSLTRWRAEPRPEKPKTPSHWSWLCNSKPISSGIQASRFDLLGILRPTPKLQRPTRRLSPGPGQSGLIFPGPIENVKLRG